MISARKRVERSARSGRLSPAARDLVSRAQRHERLQHFHAAAALYHRAVRRSWNSPGPQIGLARCLLQLHAWNQVAESILAAVRCGAPRFRTLFDWANLFLAEGRHQEALRLYREAGRYRAISSDPRQTARLHYNTGYTLARLGKHFAAARAYQRCLELIPTNVDAWFNLGAVYGDAGAHRLAFEAYSRVVKLAPGDPEGWNNLGNACAELSDREGAIDAYQRALAVKPSYHPAWNNLGNILQDLDRHDEAIRCYDRALMLQGEAEIITLFNRALSLISSGRTREGLRDMHRWALIPPLPDNGAGSARGPDWEGLLRSLSASHRRTSV